MVSLTEFVAFLLLFENAWSSLCFRDGSDWICGERMCAASGLTRFTPVATQANTPQSLAWDDDAYAKALQLFDAITAAGSRSLLLPPNEEPSTPPATRVHLSNQMLKDAVTAVQGALRLYGPEGTFASFNGGKDATVVANIYAAVLADYYRQNQIHDRKKPQTVYFHLPKEFESVRLFIYSQAERLDLDLRVYEGSYKDRLEDFLTDVGGVENRGRWEKHPAFLLGIRNGDPGSEDMGVFEPASDWLHTQIPYMRVHPILSWTYGAVWDFFGLYQIPYCSLYDEGYSSLGQISETRQNRLLATGSGSDAGWTPAKYLREWSEERSGRGPREQKATSSN